MNRRQLLILLVLVAIVGGVGLLVFQRNSESWRASGVTIGQKVLGDFPLNDVTELDITDKQEGVHLAKKADRWTVQERGDYPANFQQISDFIRKLWDLKAVQSVGKVGPSQRPRLNLIEPGKGPESGTLVQLKGKDGAVIRTLLVGKTYMKDADRPSPMGEGGGYPAGRYILAGGAEEVALVSDPMYDVNPKPETWIDKEFFKVERPQTISVTGTNGTPMWKVTRETDSAEWKLADVKPGEQLDTNKAAPLSSLLSSPSFADVAPADVKPDVSGLDHPATAVIETFDKFTYTVKLGKTSGDNDYLTVAVSADLPKERTPGKDEKPEDRTRLDKEFADKNKTLQEKLAKEKAFETRVYLVPKYTVEQITKDRSQLLAEKKPEPAPSASPAASTPMILPTAPVEAPSPATTGTTPAAPQPSVTGTSHAVVTPAAQPSPKTEAVYTAPVSWPPTPTPSASPAKSSAKTSPAASGTKH